MWRNANGKKWLLCFNASWGLHIKYSYLLYFIWDPEVLGNFSDEAFQTKLTWQINSCAHVLGKWRAFKFNYFLVFCVKFQVSINPCDKLYAKHLILSEKKRLRLNIKTDLIDIAKKWAEDAVFERFGKALLVGGT